MTSKVNDIVNFSIDSLYRLFANEARVTVDMVCAEEFAIIERFFPEIEIDNSSESSPYREELFPHRRLFRPFYWYLMQNYATPEQDPTSSIVYLKLQRKFPPKKKFKREVLQQKNNLGEKWVLPYLASNLEQASKSL